MFSPKIVLIKIRFRSDVPPPIPPHISRAQPPKVEYRPPVPPHRNIGVTANTANVANGKVIKFLLIENKFYCYL